MSALTAVDILLNPDASMLALAETYNGRMLTSIPSPPGFALDANHRPHITTLQRYVRTAELDHVYEAVQGVVSSVDLSTLTLTAHALAHMEMQPTVGLGAIVVTPGPAVLDFQARLMEAVGPFTESGGTADAFVRTDTEPDINDTTIGYIENYVPQHSGKNYLAHVTVGLGKLDYLAAVEAETFEPLTFSAGSISIYHLGNNGTAAKELKTWEA